MIPTKPLCPTCGKPAIGTLERLEAIARFDDGQTGPEYTYSGFTDVLWDSQKTVRGPGGAPIFICEKWHQWSSGLKKGTRDGIVAHPNRIIGRKKCADCGIYPPTNGTLCEGCISYREHTQR